MAEAGLLLAEVRATKQVGDLLVFHGAGAYGASMSSNDNGRLQAAEYLMDGANSRPMRRRQTIDELYEMELVAGRAAEAARRLKNPRRITSATARQSFTDGAKSGPLARL